MSDNTFDQNSKPDELNNAAETETNRESETEKLIDVEPKTNHENEDNYKHAELQTKVKSLEIEVEDWKNKSLRIAADLQNLQKQHDLDISGAKKSAKKHLAQSLTTFITTLNLAFTFAPKSDDDAIIKFINTLKFSFESLLKDLESQGIKILIPVIGAEFDPITMTALNSPETEGDNLQVKQIVSVGLSIDGQLVQSTNVMV